MRTIKSIDAIVLTALEFVDQKFHGKRIEWRPEGLNSTTPDLTTLRLFAVVQFSKNISYEELQRNILYPVRFQVLTAASMNMAVFWVVAPYSLVEVYRRFIVFMMEAQASLKRR
jgi:hypothetical protein